MSQPNFTVYTYNGEIEFLKSLVELKDNIETGGDLFGLWLDDNKVVIQLISGPGQNCRRTTTSFHQDVEYLGDVGTHLTTKEGLCNVGEWHSHHRLGLPRPSAGDEQTVWRNMPVGITKFVLFIANISGSKKGKPKVNVGCFLFDKVTKLVVDGEFKDLREACSPLRKKPEVQNVLECGAEKKDVAPTRNGNKSKKGKRKNEKAVVQAEKIEGNEAAGDKESAKRTKRNRKEDQNVGRKLRSSSTDVKDEEKKNYERAALKKPNEDKMKEKLPEVKGGKGKKTKREKEKTTAKKDKSETNEAEDGKADTKLKEKIGEETEDHNEENDKKAVVEENKEAEEKDVKMKGDQDGDSKTGGEGRERKLVNEKESEDVGEKRSIKNEEVGSGSVRSEEKQTKMGKDSTESKKDYRPVRQGKRKSKRKPSSKQGKK